MAETNLTLTVDDAVIQKAEPLFNNVGETIVSAWRKYLNKRINDGYVPTEDFDDEIYPDDDELFYSKSNMDAIDEGIKSLAEGKGIEMTIEEFHAWTAELKAKYQ